eukprot:scaffold35751_cov21-Tisochrysis_lutea.AAC.1
MHSNHTPTQGNAPPSTQNVNSEAKDNLRTPSGDAPFISAYLPGIQREDPKVGPPSKRRHSTKKQESRHVLQQCSQDTPEPSVNQPNTPPETLQICPQTGEVTATRSIKPNSKPPKKKKAPQTQSKHHSSGGSCTPNSKPLAEHSPIQCTASPS